MKSRTLLKRGPLGIVAAGAALGLAFATPASAARPNSAEVANDTLTVTGSSASERLALRLKSGDTNTLEVDFGDDGTADHSVDRSTFSRIRVLLKPGNDTFRVDQVNGAFADESLTVEGGSGNDVMNGGDNIETFDGGSGDDFADGNRGNDTGVMGSGNDVFQWDPGDGNDTIEGNSGRDTLDFNGKGGDEIMSLSAEGTRSVFLRNLANIRMDMNSVEVLDLDALGGIDTVSINDMTGTGFQRADVDLQGPAGGPDGAADVVTVNGSAKSEKVDVDLESGAVKVSGLSVETHVAGAEAADTLQVKTGDGDDDVDVDSAVIGVIGLSIDLGAGEI